MIAAVFSLQALKQSTISPAPMKIGSPLNVGNGGIVGVLTDVDVGADVAVGGTGVNVDVGNGVAVGVSVGVEVGVAHEESASAVMIRIE